MWARSAQELLARGTRPARGRAPAAAPGRSCPSPGSDSTAIEPPCCSTIAWAIERPRPLPGIACSWASEERKNRVNSCSCSWRGMPMPVSATSMHARLRADQRAGRSTLAALGRELHGVADQVDHHPLEHVAVAEERDRLVGQLDVELERAALERSGRRPRSRPRRPCAGRRRGRPSPSPPSWIRESVSRSSMSESSRELLVADPAYGVELLVAELAVRAVLEHLDVAEDAGDRRAQLVADAGDEGVLDLVDLAQPLDRLALGLERLDQPALGLDPLGDVLGGADVADHLRRGRRRCG